MNLSDHRKESKRRESLRQKEFFAVLHKMACVTLKRPIDVLGSPHVEQQPLTKRKRCGPLLFPTTPPSTGKKRLKRLLDLDDMPVSPSSEKSISKPPSQFLTVTPPMETG